MKLLYKLHSLLGDKKKTCIYTYTTVNVFTKPPVILQVYFKGL